MDQGGNMPKKPKCNLIPFFIQWLKETNNCNGLIETYNIKKKHDYKYIETKLSHINSSIHLTIMPTEVNIAVYYHRECYDFLRSIDIEVRINKEERYYCAQCPPDDKTYETEYELCVDHSFEQIREYFQSIAQPGKCLVLRYKTNSFSDATVVDKEMISSIDKEYVTAVIDIIDMNNLIIDDKTI